MKEQLILNPKYLIWMVLITLSVNVGCSKGEQWLDAVILDLGSPSVDGCGYIVKIEEHTYYPINLEEKYQVDKKTVKVRYDVLEDMHACGFSHSEVKYQKVIIRDIRD